MRGWLPSGTVLPEDPWQAEHYDVWSMRRHSIEVNGGVNEVLDFFRPLIDEAIAGLIKARPKILGLSIQQCNESISREIVRGVKKADSDNLWDGGTILDSLEGKIYKVRMTPIEGGKKMEVRGYVGMPLLGRTQTWIRVE